jgi:glycosyltransferase 2 family protein
MTDARRGRGAQRKLFYWGLPIAILSVVFSRVDLRQFVGLLRSANPWWLILGLLSCPAGIVAGAWRWRILLSLYLGRRVPPAFALRHYYIGLAVGFFAPASVGWDLYRIAVAGKQFGSYGWNVVAVVAEKLAAVISMILLIAGLYPMVGRLMTGQTAWMEKFAHGAYFAAIALLLLLALAALLRRNRVTLLMLRGLEPVLERMLSPWRKEDAGSPKPVAPLAAAWGVLRPFLHLRLFLLVLLPSLLVQAIAGVGVYFNLVAIGCSVPVIVPVFVVPLMTCLFMLPVSFGSLGVREAAYILLFGLFGVSREAALAASCLGLLGLILNQVTGAAVMFLSGGRPTVAALNRKSS